MELKEIGRKVTKRFSLIASENDEKMKIIAKSNSEIVLEVTSIESVPNN